MPRFRIQSNLHLDGFQMLDACLENVTSFEGLDDRNTGRIVFLNGSSSNKSNLHPAVFYGNEFKGLAYLDDIEAITNGEGSLGTRVKTLEDMLNVDSAETVVSTWAEIQAFLDQVQEGTDLMDLLNRKFDKTGGRITGNLIMDGGHVVTREIYAGADNTYDLGKLGRRWANIHTMLINGGTPIHSGNVGEYTAGAAKKLETPVSLWGNNFDGTQSLNGNITIRAQGTVSFTIADGTSVVDAIQVNSLDNLLIGQGVARNSGDTLVYGNNIKFCYGSAGSSAQTAMTITDEGNVLVGNSYLSDALFSVKGLASIYVSGSALSLDDLPDNGLVLGGTHYTLAQFLQNSDDFAIQSYRKDTATALALNLNPLGGAVNVGGDLAPNADDTIFLGTSSYRWRYLYSVNGNFSNSLRVGGHLRGMIPSGGTYDEWRIFNNQHGLYIQSGSYDGLSTNGTLNLTGIDDDILTNLNVKATVSSFSGRVLIGGAEDDGTSALRVNGLATFNAGALIPTGQKLTIGDATIEYDSIAKAIKVDGNLFTTGTNASGGKAAEGEGGTGGASGTIREFTIDPPTDNTSSFKLEHSFNTEKVIVQIFELNGNSGKYEMILTDVEITDANNVTVTFGRKPTEYHKVYVMA